MRAGSNRKAKHLRVKRWTALGAVALALVFGGCAVRKEAVKGHQTEPAQDESFDLLSLGIEELPLSEVETQQTLADTSKAAPLALQPVSSGTEEDMVPGYRVQLCATPDEAAARAYYHDALMKFMDLGVYLQFDSPYYKVRVGDCKSRFEAEELQKRVQQSGFPDAWVVRTKVYVSPPARGGESETPLPKQE
jgi:hypothetical protein